MNLTSWQTWLVISALIIGLVLPVFMFKQDRQDVELLDNLQVTTNEIIVIYSADNIDIAREYLRKEYPANEWVIIEEYFDADRRRAYFRLVKEG